MMKNRVVLAVVMAAFVSAGTAMAAEDLRAGAPGGKRYVLPPDHLREPDEGDDAMVRGRRMVEHVVVSPNRLDVGKGAKRCQVPRCVPGESLPEAVARLNSAIAEDCDEGAKQTQRLELELADATALLQVLQQP